MDKRVQPIDHFDEAGAAGTAIAARGAAELDELLAPERDAAIAAVAGANIDLCFVKEFHDFYFSVFERIGYRFASQSSLRRLRRLICARKRVKTGPRAPFRSI